MPSAAGTVLLNSSKELILPMTENPVPMVISPLNAASPTLNHAPNPIPPEVSGVEPEATVLGNSPSQR